METTEKTYTYVDYAELPEGPPYYQLIGGELIMIPSPSTFHQQVIGNLYGALREYVQDHAGVALFAPIDVYLSETEVYQPDIVFIGSDRREIVEEHRINGAPDLVIEVLSPSTGYYDLTHKKRKYAEHGVKEYGLVDPLERTVELFEHQDGTFQQVLQLRKKGVAQSHLLEGWQLTLDDIFRSNLRGHEQ
jgi:Uma2 family endonuclease